MIKRAIIGCQMLFYLIFLIFIFGNVRADVVNAVDIQNLPEIKKTINELVSIIKAKNFNALRHYVSNEAKIRWIDCGAHEGAFKYSTDRMIKMLLEYSTDVPVYVNGDPEIGVIDSQKGIYTIVIQTEGWTNEYPFLDFSFEYSKNTNRWNWFGVCYDAEPPLKYSQTKHKFVREYYRKPALPRPGPRVFKDAHALSARIGELIKFGALDALKVYAIKGMVVFSKCGQTVIVSDNLEGEYVVPVEKVINFLKKAFPGESEIIIRGRGDLRTAGWRGEFPNISFVLSQTKEGWTWNHVVYCGDNAK